MLTARVAVTGMAGITSLGQSWPEVERSLHNNVSGIERMPEWERYTELNTRLGGPVRNFELPAHYTRKVTRSMGRVSMLATRASELAIEDAGLLDDSSIRDGRMGVAYGSSTGSTDAVRDFGAMLTKTSNDIIYNLRRWAKNIDAGVTGIMALLANFDFPNAE